MPKIHKLPPHEAQKIAAGEVVERPANVVKELVENAIDAGASTITVYIEHGGKTLIRVVDNGCGMNADDALLCFEHHATSKIRVVEDLQTITTFGFRGEALSSIAAVSEVTLITKTAMSDALKVCMRQGTLISHEPASANIGTDIAIRNLFFNVPARKKFLKSDDTEWNAIKQLFHAFCLNHIAISFKLLLDGKQIIHCPSTDSITQRAEQLFNDSTTSTLLEFHARDAQGNITISGVTSNHQFMRYDRSSIFFFVNSRWVKQQKLTSALLKGYLNVLPQGRYPMSCIFITIDPTHVDINIHPRKEEVQFLHPRVVEQLLQKAVKEALEKHVSRQLKRDISFAPATEIIAPFGIHTLPIEPMYKPRLNTEVVTVKNIFDAPVFAAEQKAEPHTKQPVTHTKPLSPVTTHTFEQPMAPAVMNREEYAIIGQYNKTYILVEKENSLLLIDQHAAHERILYEQFTQRFEDVATVKLLFPQIVTLTANDIQTIEPHLPLFAAHGLDINVLSDTQLVIYATPVHIKNQSLEDIIKQTIGWVTELTELPTDQFSKAIHEKLHAQMACKAAVKAGDVLTQAQMQKLIDDLDVTNNRLTCPHGRPTCWNLSVSEIEKKFKRKV